MELLKLEHVSLSYHTPSGETPVLQDISLSLEQGEFAAIVGPSGCGKSTVLNLIDGLISPESGKILIAGKPAAESSRSIGYMLQKDHLFEWRTVYSNLLLGLEIRRKLTPENLARVEAMLTSYGLAPFRNSRPSELSGGMRQRAALIRTLALDPSLLLLDEPFPPWTIRPVSRWRTTSARSSAGNRRRRCWLPTISGRPSAWRTGCWSFLPVLPGSAG